jgi:hypothetical protein
MNAAAVPYTARVNLVAEAVAGLGESLQLHPGMPADVVVVSSQHTLLSVLLCPLSDVVFKSFRN